MCFITFETNRNNSLLLLFFSIESKVSRHKITLFVILLLNQTWNKIKKKKVYLYDYVRRRTINMTAYIFVKIEFRQIFFKYVFFWRFCKFGDINFIRENQFFTFRTPRHVKWFRKILTVYSAILYYKRVYKVKWCKSLQKWIHHIV